MDWQIYTYMSSWHCHLLICGVEPISCSRTVSISASNIFQLSYLYFDCRNAFRINKYFGRIHPPAANKNCQRQNELKSRVLLRSTNYLNSKMWSENSNLWRNSENPVLGCQLSCHYAMVIAGLYINKKQKQLLKGHLHKPECHQTSLLNRSKIDWQDK